MKKILTTVFAFICLFAAASDALACACCAEPNTYLLSTGKPSDYVQSLFGEIKFAPKTELYITEAGFDAIRGLGAIEQDVDGEPWSAENARFDLVAEFTKKTWRLNFKTRSGKTGTLVLPVPAQMVIHKIDTHDSEDTGLGVRLYKEFRFKGPVASGTGFFRAGLAAPATYFLVFQGRGNGCDNAEDFTHWHLEIEGRRASYQFNGRLGS